MKIRVMVEVIIEAVTLHEANQYILESLREPLIISACIEASHKFIDYEKGVKQ